MQPRCDDCSSIDQPMNDDWQLAMLDDGTTLVTANKRLATELRRQYDAAKSDAGLTVWASPDILPWQAWLMRQYLQLLDDGEVTRDLLNPAQEQLLWQAVIADDSRGSSLLRPRASAQAAANAYSLLRAWNLDRYPLAQLGGEETEVLLHWRDDFEQRLARQDLISLAELPALLADAITAGRLHPPQRLVHSGFDALAPAQRMLLDSLQAAGCEIAELRQTVVDARCYRIEADDPEHEIVLAARWARHRLVDRPRQRIAIVAPQITRQRAELTRVFSATLAPRSYLAGVAQSGLFNLSLGEALSEQPLVAHALLALDLLLGRPQPLNAIGQLLRSPFLGGQQEASARALLDAQLRSDGVPELSLANLMHRMKAFVDQDRRQCTDLQARLDAAIALLRSQSGALSPARWARHIQQLLTTLGWPGDRPLSSREYQQQERLMRSFSELAQLGKVRRRLSLTEALSLLKNLCSETVFQAESAAAAVQILGPLEAAGLNFDAIWLLGMHDQVWPAAPNPDPLLPTALQRELGMPHASAARELAFAASLTARLATAAPLVIASHARSDGEREQRVSALLAEWPLAPDSLVVAAADDSDDLLHRACGIAGTTETLPTPQARGTASQQSGGAQLLAAQAACPFNALAAFRLKARPLDEASHAPDNLSNGIVVHDLLERLWRELRDSTRLAGYDDSELSRLIERLARQTLNEIAARRPDLYGSRFIELECARLTRLMTDWLDVERRRQLAFSVVALEAEREIALGRLKLATRIDRIDRLSDGRLAIIDYKTGSRVSAQGWQDERLSEPQLPLYSTSDDGSVAATLLAKVRNDDKGCRFVGFADDARIAPDVDLPQSIDDDFAWSDLLQHWRRALQLLADEIADGRCDPTPSPPACEHCDFGALCRHRQLLNGNADD